MLILTDSPWCTSGKNCDNCRKPGTIRNNILAKWPDLVCPRGLPLREESKQFNSLDMNLSDHCNMGCSFCYAKHNYGNGANMEMHKKTLDWFVGQADENNLSVTIYGGEPLCEFNSLVHLWNYAKTLKKKIRFSVISNISLLDETKLKWLIGHNVSIGSSIDGCQEAQDCARVFKDGSSSAKTVFENAVKLTKARASNHVRATITPESAKYLLKSVQHLASLGYNDISCVHADGVKWTEESLAVLAEQTRLLTDWWMDEIRKGNIINLFHITHVLRSVVPNQRKNRPCGAGRSMVAVDTNGDIWPCHRFCNLESPKEWKLGNVSTGVTNTALLDRIRGIRLTGKERPECEGCAAFMTCHAFCVHTMAVKNGLSATDASQTLPAALDKCAIWPTIYNEVERAHNILVAENNQNYINYYNRFSNVKQEAKKYPPCEYMQITTEDYAKCRTCKGKKVICQDPSAEKMPDGTQWQWYENGCNPTKCKRYKEKKQCL